MRGVAWAVGTVLLSAAALSAWASAAARPRLLRVARMVSLAAAFVMLLVVARPPARPFAAFAVVAALVGPQPLPLALAAAAAVLAGMAPPVGASSTALVLAGVGAAVGAHALARSWPRRAPAMAADGAGPGLSAVPTLLVGADRGEPVDEEQSALVLSRLVVVAALAAALAAGIEGWLREGSYLTLTTQRLLSASLLALAASETTRAVAAARALALGGLVVVLLP